MSFYLFASNWFFEFNLLLLKGAETFFEIFPLIYHSDQNTSIKPSRPNLGQRERINSNFFSYFFVVPQKAFIKPFEAPQRSVKIKI